MAWTDLEIANMALIRMGIHKQLTALPDTSSEGKALAVLLPKVKERVLSAHPWNWALRHVALVEATDTPAELPFGWALAYDKPADLFQPVRVWPGARRQPVENEVPFQVALVGLAPVVSAVVQTTPAGRTPGTGTFALTGTPAENGEFSILIVGGSSEPLGGGEQAGYAVVSKNGVFQKALELFGPPMSFPYDAAGVGLAGITIAMVGAAATFSTGDSYTFTVTGAVATTLAVSVVTQTQPAGRTTPAAGTFVISGTPTAAGEFMLLGHDGVVAFDDMGDPANVVYVFKDFAYRGMAGLDDAKTPIDGALYGADGLTITQTLPATGNYKRGEMYSFTVSGTEAIVPAEYLLTDAEDAELVYVSNGWLATVPTLAAPDHVSDTVAWLMAAELAMPLAKRPDLSAYLAQTAQRTLNRAIALDRGVVAPDPAPVPFNISARG